MLRTTVSQFDLGAHFGKQLAGGFNVAHLWNIFEDDRFVGKNGGCHGREGGVLGSADANCPQQRITAANDQFVHVEIIP